MAIMASFASSMFSNVTKPKPLDLCVSLSFTTTTSEICPYLEKTCSSDCSLVSKLSPPTNSLPSSDAIVTGVRNRRNHTTLQHAHCSLCLVPLRSTAHLSASCPRQPHLCWAPCPLGAVLAPYSPAHAVAGDFQPGPLQPAQPEGGCRTKLLAAGSAQNAGQSGNGHTPTWGGRFTSWEHSQGQTEPGPSLLVT